MFLPNVPEATFIPGATLISESRVYGLCSENFYSAQEASHTEQAHIVDYTQLHSTRPKSITNEDTKENNPHWLPFMFYPSTQSDFLVESQEAKEK